MIKYIRQNFWRVLFELTLLGIGFLLLWYFGYGIFVLPIWLIYTALKISLIGAIEFLFDKKIQMFNSPPHRNTAISYTDESD